MEDIRFEAARAADLADIQALLRTSGLPSDDLGADDLRDFIVARRGGAIVASVGLQPLGEVALLRSLAVAPDLRGLRIGHALWEKARERARARGFTKLYLLTTTAAGLFERLGFQAISRELAPDVVRSTSEFASLCPSTATVMMTDLP
jgi:amino-acid N-acetyltransferase